MRRPVRCGCRTSQIRSSGYLGALGDALGWLTLPALFAPLAELRALSS